MDENQRYYDVIAKQEAMLQFTTFTADTAMEIGLKLVARFPSSSRELALWEPSRSPDCTKMTITVGRWRFSRNC